MRQYPPFLDKACRQARPGWFLRGSRPAGKSGSGKSVLRFDCPDFMEIAPDGSIAADIKHTYTQAFVIYALSKYMEFVQDDKVLGVIRGFYILLESKAKDPAHPGYFEAFTRNWDLFYENRMADAVAREGVDQGGGLFLESTRFGSHLRTNKHWWPQAENLVGFMNAFEMTGDPSPFYRNDWKIDPWKCHYHNGRAMLQLMQRCRKMCQ